MPDQRLEHDRLANPKTVADIQAAIQNPYSPIHKELVNEILEAEDWHMLLDKIIEEHVLQHYKMEALEEKQLYMSLLALKLNEQKRLQLFYAQEGKPLIHEAELARLDKPEFVQRLDSRAGLISELQSQYDDISQQYESIGKEEKQIDAKWKELTIKHAADFVNDIKKNDVKLYDDKGVVINEDKGVVEEIIAHAFKTPSPMDLLNKIVASHEKYNEVYQKQLQKEKVDAAAPPAAPALSPALSNPFAMAGMNNILNEIKLNVICAGNTDSAQCLLAAIKNNKTAGEMLAKNEVKIAEDKDVCARAIDCFQRGHDLKNQKDHIEEKLKLEESKQEQEIEHFKKLTGQDYHLMSKP